MSVSIRTCPDCDSLILADTFQCPDCGHVFDEEKANQVAGVKELAAAEVEDPCPDCNHMVRAGLVRCPECGRFMRDDIAKKFDAMRSRPQKIIYSDIPPEERTDYLPPRDELDERRARGGAPKDDDGFELSTDVASDPQNGEAEVSPEDGFELGPVGQTATPPADAATVEDRKTEAARTVDDPREKTDGDETDDDKKDDDASETKTASDETRAASPGKDDAPDMNADELLAIAKADEKEASRRRIRRRRADKARSVLVPCPCSAWIRVREHQTGRNVRCPQCKRTLPIPQLTKKKAETDKPVAQVEVPWLRDVDYILVDPENLKLKPGSVAGDAAPVDLLFSTTGISVCTLVAPPKKASLFGSRSKDAQTPEQKRELIQEFLTGGGAISGVPAEKTVFVPADEISKLLVVQPVQQAHESMFAGIPVFGEGRIAVRVPAETGDDKQRFLSLGLTDFRFLAKQLTTLFAIEDFGVSQGVPQGDATSTLKCHYTGSELESVRELAYYESDRHIETKLIGRKCGACGIAVSEESRKKEKIGGAGGRGLSRAKCPKCNGKFGNNPLYTFSVRDTAPGTEEADLETPSE